MRKLQQAIQLVGLTSRKFSAKINDMPSTNCTVCKKSFYVKPRRQKLGWGKYCSRTCQFIGQHSGAKYPCSTCNTLIYRTPRDVRKSSSGHFFCNRSCFAKYKNSLWALGEEHFNWKNGRGSYRNLMLRSSKEPPVCKNCGIDDARVLVVHHVDHDRQNNDQSNLKWLCRNCHYLTHQGKTI